MAQKRVITVFGATGSQGGALVRAALADGEFAVRAVTRNPDSDRARELVELGADVVPADMDDAASLPAVLEGAYGAYVVTNFWEHMSARREKEQAQAVAHAAAHAGVQHVIWSTLEDTRDCIPLDDERMPVLQGEYKVPHFDGKAEADHYFTDEGAPTTFLRTTFYWENLLTTFAPQLGEDGVLRIVFPMGTSRLSGIGVDDIGRTALSVFKRGTDLIGATVSIAGEHLALADMAAVLTEVAGRPVEYAPLTPDEFRALGFPGADEAGNMFQFYADCEERFVRARDLQEVRALDPELQSFATWAAAHREEFARL
ncbi:NmrA/HSCARG family protein [Streptomyces bambusae]|uniref:NAD(P)H-binding protein n=1 Tax=Streptomyces bambusae TaxID=1550616 RepID=A0ABS6Z5W6_9ACTN|nr:NmrA/HSCARG family protein [Streptomyces bambusae]MBW5482784.1 NAD(P)H-binding protein [Streptomyces bambusae]